MKKLFLIYCLLGFQLVYGQKSVSIAIELLDKGDYNEAAQILGEVIQDDPKNKTAWICYGRALGLAGGTERAYKVFDTLMILFPGDYEVGLNKAEANMWLGKYKEAKENYSILVAREDADYKAFWGMANSCFSLGEFELAYNYINKALQAYPGNADIINSKKYILLGLAEQQRDQWKFEQASQSLETILNLLPDDREGLLNLAILHLYEKKIHKAFNTYKFIYLNKIDSFEGLMGMSYTSILKGNQKKALYWIETIIQDKAMVLSHDQQQRAELQYINCLLLNEFFEKAESQAQMFREEYGNNQRLEMILARQWVQKAKWKIANESYSNMIKKYPENYEILVSAADMKQLYGQIEDAVSFAEKAIVAYPHRPDARTLLERIKTENNIRIYTEAGIYSDNNSNRGKSLDIKLFLKNRRGLQPTFSLSHKLAKDLSGNSAHYQKWMTGLKWTIHPGLKLDIKMGVSNTDAVQFESKKWKWLADTRLQFRLKTKQTLGITYRVTQQDYSVSLLSRQLYGHELGVNYNHQLSERWNLYVNTSINIQTDGNVKKALYVSNYLNLKQIPLLQLGVNIQYIGFNNSEISEYFSPNRYVSLESFVLLSNLRQSHQKLKYDLFMASGLQDIDGDKQFRGRLNAKLGYNIARNLTIFGMYEMNNAIENYSDSYSFRDFRLMVQYVFN